MATEKSKMTTEETKAVVPSEAVMFATFMHRFVRSDVDHRYTCLTPSKMADGTVQVVIKPRHSGQVLKITIEER